MTDNDNTELTFLEEVRKMAAEEARNVEEAAIKILAAQTGISEKAIRKALEKESPSVFRKLARGLVVKAEDTSIIGGAAYTLLTGDLNGLFPVAGGLFSKFTRRLGIPAGKLAYRRLKGSGSARTKN